MRWLWAALVLAVAVAGWQSWRAERIAAACARARADAAADAAMVLKQAQADTASARAELNKAKEAERDLPNGNSCGLDAGRVRLLPGR